MVLLVRNDLFMVYFTVSEPFLSSINEQDLRLFMNLVANVTALNS